MHVAQSHFHDIVPAHELGVRSIWITRLAERGQPAPTRERARRNQHRTGVDNLKRPEVADVVEVSSVTAPSSGPGSATSTVAVPRTDS